LPRRGGNLLEIANQEPASAGRGVIVIRVLAVVFVPNYRVSLAERIIPAASPRSLSIPTWSATRPNEARCSGAKR